MEFLLPVRVITSFLLININVNNSNIMKVLTRQIIKEYNDHCMRTTNQFRQALIEHKEISLVRFRTQSKSLRFLIKDTRIQTFKEFLTFKYLWQMVTNLVHKGYLSTCKTDPRVDPHCDTFGYIYIYIYIPWPSKIFRGPWYQLISLMHKITRAESIMVACYKNNKTYQRYCG